MGKKFVDMESDERKQIQEQLDGMSASLGMDSWESYGNGSQTGLKQLVGMCHDCKYLYYCKTEFGDVFAKCTELGFKLSGQNRIAECNIHAPKYTLSLTDMYSIAYLIDTDKNKKIKGFTDV